MDIFQSIYLSPLTFLVSSSTTLYWYPDLGMFWVACYSSQVVINIYGKWAEDFGKCNIMIFNTPTPSDPQFVSPFPHQLDTDWHDNDQIIVFNSIDIWIM